MRALVWRQTLPDSMPGIGKVPRVDRGKAINYPG